MITQPAKGSEWLYLGKWWIVEGPGTRDGQEAVRLKIREKTGPSRGKYRMAVLLPTFARKALPRVA